MMSKNPAHPSSIIPHRFLRIGIDLDNTIIDYDRAFLTAARERKLLPEHFTGNKQQVRDHIRTLPGGETEWQKLQGYVYGRGIGAADLFPGVGDFFSQALSQGHELFIVSHKTEFGHFDETKTSLREAAMQFLQARDFFNSSFTPAHVSFHDTRVAKVNKIAEISPVWFIDDLVEVYEESHFPEHVKKILFHSPENDSPLGHWHTCRDWQSIVKTIFA